MLYFDHDTGAMGDPKLAQLCIEEGAGAVAAYWVILEQIYRTETALVVFENQAGNRPLTKVVSHWLSVDVQTLEKWISAMIEIGLLERVVENPGAVTSKRAAENIQAYHEKRETARQNGKRGGRKPTKKPNPNRAGNQGQNQDETEPLANKRKEKGLGFDKQNLNLNASSVAAAAEAAPLEARKTGKPRCPLCGEKLFRNGQTGRWDCPACLDSFDDSKAVWT